MGRTSAKTKRKPKLKTAKERTAQRKRLDALRPILAADITDQQVEALFDKRVVFAEELLAEFLPLIGISSGFALLSYKYFAEPETKELAANQDIRFIRELRFERDAPV